MRRNAPQNHNNSRNMAVIRPSKIPGSDGGYVKIPTTNRPEANLWLRKKTSIRACIRVRECHVKPGMHNIRCMRWGFMHIYIKFHIPQVLPPSGGARRRELFLLITADLGPVNHKLPCAPSCGQPFFVTTCLGPQYKLVKTAAASCGILGEKNTSQALDFFRPRSGHKT